MAWEKVLTNNTSPIDVPYAGMAPMSVIETEIPNTGDYRGETMILQNSGVTNDLTSDVGKCVTWDGEKWELSSASTTANKGQHLSGLVTIDTAASKPIILTKGIMRLDAISSFDTTPFLLGSIESRPIYMSTSSIGKVTMHPGGFSAGNIARLMGYVLAADSGNASGEEFLYIYFNPDVFYMEL